MQASSGGARKDLLMAYYDHIATQWHEATGYRGGPFKELVLNDVLLNNITSIESRSILELGTGNGYFLPMVLRRFSGQVPSAIVVTDQSSRLLEIAEKHFRIPEATYQLLDVRRRFPFDESHFDLILASMVFNELSSGHFKRALQESLRVLSPGGLFLMSVIHPDFVRGLQMRGLLSTARGGTLTMPAGGSLRLPVVLRSSNAYRHALAGAGFRFEEEMVYPTNRVLSARPGLRNSGSLPIALVFRCTH